MITTFVTTTSGNLDFVPAVAGVVFGPVRVGMVHICNVTAGYGAMNLAGPKSRGRIAQACRLRTSRLTLFPYMACREAKVGGIPATLLRIGFVGENGVGDPLPGRILPKSCGRKLLDAGHEFGIRPFGVEAQRLLRLEKRHIIVGVDHRCAHQTHTKPVWAGR